MTIFPPYFVAGAIFSGFAMVITLAIPVRYIYGLETIITMGHLDKMAKIMLVTGSMVGYAYAMEFFIAWYSNNTYESFAFCKQSFWTICMGLLIMISCNVIVPTVILV